MNTTVFWTVVVVGILVFVIAREFVCWYFKVNEIVGLLRSIDESLRGRAAPPAAQPLQGQRVEG